MRGPYIAGFSAPGTYGPPSAMDTVRLSFVRSGPFRQMRNPNKIHHIDGVEERQPSASENADELAARMRESSDLTPERLQELRARVERGGYQTRQAAELTADRILDEELE